MIKKAAEGSRNSGLRFPGTLAASPSVARAMQDQQAAALARIIHDDEPLAP